MPLTVLPSAPSSQTPADLIRLFHQSQLEWARHIGDETELDFGRWISNPLLPLSSNANCLLDAFLLPGLNPTQLVEAMSDRSHKTTTPWLACTLNPSKPIEQIKPLKDYLLQAGWQPKPLDILHRAKPVAIATTRSDLTIIPARASYRLYRQLMQQRADSDGGEGPDTALLHLDDSHLDILLALQAGVPVGSIGVLASGQVGTIREWYVAAAHRDKGIGRLLLCRAIEICSRSLLRHIMAGVNPKETIATHLLQIEGFEPIGQWSRYLAPA